MFSGLDATGWRYIKLAVGGLLILGGLGLLVVLEPFETVQSARLEQTGKVVSGTVTTVRVSDHQAARPSRIGTYALFRRVGASRLTSAGAALAQGRGSRTTYYDVGYEFPALGERFGGMAHIQLDRQSVVREGATVSVLADVSQPAVHRLIAYSRPTSMGSAIAGFGFVFLSMAAGGLLVWMGLAKSTAEARSTFASPQPAARDVAARRIARPAAQPERAVAAPARRPIEASVRKPREFSTRQRGA